MLMRTILKNIDILKLSELIEKSNSKEIWELRGQLHMIYGISNLKDVYQNDKTNIDELKKQSEKIMNNEKDKIKQ